MHGLVNRAIQCFLSDTYGADAWHDIAEGLDIGADGFEALSLYPDGVTQHLLARAAERLRRPPDGLLEDLGTYLVSHPNTAAIRRLLRFGGASFAEFLYSLDDLPGRARLAVPDLDLPRLHLREHDPTRFELCCGPGIPQFACVMAGVLRAMADDYGALVFLDHAGSVDGWDIVAIDLHDARFAEGRSFELAGPAP